MDTQISSRMYPRSRVRFRIIVAVGSIVALFVLAVVIDAAISYNKIHSGISIAGHDVGGLTREQATTRLTSLVKDAQKGVVLTDGAKSWTVQPADVGTNMDVASSVSAAMAVTRKSNFLADLGKRFKLYFSHVDIPLNGTVDTALMDKVLGGIAQQLDTQPVNAGLSIEGSSIKVIEGQNGRVVDQATLREQIKSLLLTMQDGNLTIPMVTKSPAVQAADNQEAQKQAETMISAPVVLQDGDQSWTLTPDQIAGFMDFTSQDQNGVSTLVPYISADKMASFLTSIAPDVATKPVDASFKQDGTKAWVVPGVPGKALDPQGTVQAVTTAALETSGRTAQVAVTETDPKLTTAEAQAMGIKDRLSTYTTPPYTGTPNRQVNVRITTEYASNVFLAPGQEYNFDKQIGPRTAARGYKTAPGIVGPGKMEDVFGGGICQVSTTLFNAVFFAGLDVTERKNHSIYISHYPKGRDATVTAGGPNLRFVNDTSHYIWIVGTSTGIKTTFTIYGTKDGRKVTYTTSDFYNFVAKTTVTIPDPTLAPGTTVVETSGQQGMQCKVTRTVTAADGSVIHNDVFLSTWPMLPKQVRVGPSVTTTTVPGSTTSTTSHNGGSTSTTTTTVHTTTTNF